MSHSGSTVAIVRSNNRRGAVAEALALIADDLAAMASEVTILPDFTATRRPWAWTHPDTLSATLDALFAKGADRVSVRVADRPMLSRSRLQTETIGRPVGFCFDSDRAEPKGWTRLDLDADDDGPPCSIRVERAGSLASLSTMKTDGIFTVGSGLANLIHLVHPEDRAALGCSGPGPRGPWGATFGRIKGRASRIKELMTRHDLEAWRRLGPEAIASLRSAKRSAQLVAAVAEVARPLLSIVDGFGAIHREGPHEGVAVDLGVVVAGVDPVAVDAVAAAVMGFDPPEVLHLQRAFEKGLGQVDLRAIRIVGDSLGSVRRRCVPHSNQRILRHANRLPDLISPPKRDSIIPEPHARPVRSTNLEHSRNADPLNEV